MATGGAVASGRAAIGGALAGWPLSALFCGFDDAGWLQALTAKPASDTANESFALIDLRRDISSLHLSHK
ncbi:hypothetical protein [Sphingomonas sp.]|uniref:hypothetical protein n=1 Tax=Sphingomonas sp. TaxID=28214 RepID=UPI0025F7BD8B|nr:hypothetical protein [Sphingomonas sp.]